jgi:hypothetical protein
MIANRGKQIKGFMDQIRDTPETRRRARQFEKSRLKKLRRGEELSRPKPLDLAANSHLEWIFGWVPLYEDIFAAMNVMTGPIPDHYVKGTGKAYWDWPVVSGSPSSGYYAQALQHYTDRVTIGAKVGISNPNLWLLNRLGLINPAVVAWDLIPWSFVVGMFANVTQVLKGFSEFVGLDITGVNTTYSQRGYVDIKTTHSDYPGLDGFERIIFTQKRRSVGGTIPNPALEFRIPDLNLGLVALTGSLLVQQSTRILKIFR